jgi:hypothetical protein
MDLTDDGFVPRRWPGVTSAGFKRGRQGVLPWGSRAFSLATARHRG